MCLYDNIQGTTPYCVKRVAVLNCWGKMRSWGNHMVHHAIYYKQNYSYFGIIEALSGAPFDVSFISFDDIREDKDLLNDFDVIINVGDADTAQSGGENWADPEIITAVREFVYNGGGFIGVGEPAAHQWQGKFFQLDDILGVEEERGFNLNTDKYNWEEHKDHFILKDTDGAVDFGEGKKNILHLPETEDPYPERPGSPDGSKNLRKRQRRLYQRTSVQLLQQPYPLSCCALVSSGRR